MKQDLFAFWPYDYFPYVLGGTVTKIHDNGRVEIKEYGSGYSFEPIKILPYKAGLALYQKVKLLKEEYEKTSRDLREKKEKELVCMMPEAIPR